MKILNELSAFLIGSINRIVVDESLLKNSRILLKTGFVCLCFSFLFSTLALAQKKTLNKTRDKASDSKIFKLIKSDEHSAKKATLFSAVIPGWGQAYNKKYWKVPIVWAGLGGIGYFIYSNNQGYKNNKDYYIYLYQNPDALISSDSTAYKYDLVYSDLGTVLGALNSYRKTRDQTILFLFAWWGLNIIDANVDGHFFNFDIDEDLSLKLSPVAYRISGNKPALGINLVFNLY